MTEYNIWCFEKECKHVTQQNQNDKCLNILFYDCDLLHNFKISDTAEFNNMKEVCELNENLHIIQYPIETEKMLSSEILYGKKNGTLLFSDSQYEEPFSDILLSV